MAEGFFGSPSLTSPRRFRRSPRYHHSRPRLIVRRTGSSTRLHVAPLQSASRSRLLGLLAERLPWGFCPLRDFSPAQHPRGNHAPWFRPRRFTRPRRVVPCLALRVCFAPLPRPGFSLQGFDPVVPWCCLVDSLAPSTLSNRSLPKVALRRHERSSRPRGFAPHDNPGSRPTGISRRPHPIPSWDSPPPGSSLQTRRTGSPFAPPMNFHRARRSRSR